MAEKKKNCTFKDCVFAKHFHLVMYLRRLYLWPYLHPPHSSVCVREVKLCSGVGDCIKTDPLTNCYAFNPTGRDTDRFNIQCVMYSSGFKTNSSGSVLVLPYGIDLL